MPRQGHNTPLPLKRSPPASFKRLLGSVLAESQFNATSSLYSGSRRRTRVATYRKLS